MCFPVLFCKLKGLWAATFNIQNGTLTFDCSPNFIFIDNIFKESISICITTDIDSILLFIVVWHYRLKIFSIGISLTHLCIIIIGPALCMILSFNIIVFIIVFLGWQCSNWTSLHLGGPQAWRQRGRQIAGILLGWNIICVFISTNRLLALKYMIRRPIGDLREQVSPTLVHPFIMSSSLFVHVLTIT